MPRAQETEIDHIDPRWKEGRDYQLVCGLDCPLNYREEEWIQNTVKSNRFLPWRWSRTELGVVPEEPGDLALFLDPDTNEWILEEFLGSWWFEKTKHTFGGGRYAVNRTDEENHQRVTKQWETLKANPDLLKKRNRSVGEGTKRWREENPELAKEADRRRAEANRRSRAEEKEKWERVNQINSQKNKKLWEERGEEIKERLQAGTEKWREENPEDYQRQLQNLHEGSRRWHKENDERSKERIKEMNKALDAWREENPEKVKEIVDKLWEGRKRWEETEEYQEYKKKNSERMSRLGKERWQCKKSGRISTAAGLTHIQKALGIDHKDPNNRIKLN